MSRTSPRPHRRLGALVLATMTVGGLGVTLAGPAAPVVTTHAPMAAANCTAQSPCNRFCGENRANCEEDARNYRLSGFEVSPIHYTQGATGRADGYWFQYWRR